MTVNCIVAEKSISWVLRAQVGVHRVVSRARQWWDEADHFDWTTEFLSQRGLLHSAQVVMAIVAGSASLVALSFLGGLSWATWVVLAVGAVGIAFTVGMTAFWLTRWPSRRQSEASIVLGTAFIAVWSIAQPNTALAVLACSSTAVTGGYIAFFHNNRLLVFNFAVAVATATSATWRLGSETNVATAIAAFWLIWFVNLTVPLAVRGMARAMGSYAVASHADPLTGLLNRRGFADAVSRGLVSAAGTRSRLALLMVDLDDFKLVNDTHGHAAGDRALQAVAELLRQRCPENAAICRAGGEEFLVAVTVSGDEAVSGKEAVPRDRVVPRGGAEALAAQLCAAVAELPHGVTASIGTSSVDLDSFRSGEVDAVLDEAVSAADTAMYIAKRNGGNRVQPAE